MSGHGAVPVSVGVLPGLILVDDRLTVGNRRGRANTVADGATVEADNAAAELWTGGRVRARGCFARRVPDRGQDPAQQQCSACDPQFLGCPAPVTASATLV